MKIFDLWFRKNNKEVIDYLLEPEDATDDIYEKDEISEDVSDNKRICYDMSSNEDRINYVIDCLEEMTEMSEQIEKLTLEYSDVTSHLTDIDEIERLPDLESKKLKECASKIAALNEDKNRNGKKKVQLTKKQYSLMQMLENEMPKPYEKLKEAEDYHAKIKSDLKKLDCEKAACEYRKEESESAMQNERAMASVCVIATIICALLLFVLQVTLELDVMVGYVIMIIAFALTMTILAIKFAENKSNERKMVAVYNKLVLLHNKVKIRYVNNTKLLDYLYAKYECTSAKSIYTMWTRYQDEIAQNQKNVQIESELKHLNLKLVRLLENCRVDDTRIWLSQARALIDQREMVEIRHYYNNQRQKLRKQIKFNNDLASETQEKIKKVVKKFPQSAEKILEIVSNYEDRVSK